MFAPKGDALAYSLTAPSTYVQPDNAFLDPSGDLVIFWHKVVLGVGGYNLDNGGVMVSIDGTSTDPELSYNGPSSGWSAGAHVLSHGGVGLNGACAPGFGSTWNSASQAPAGNEYGPFSSVWDANTNSFVPVSDITLTTPIYLTYFNYNGYTCGINQSVPATTDYWSTFNLTGINSAFGYTYVTPQPGSTIGGFANWTGIINFNETGNPSSTISINFGTSSSSLPNVVTSTMYLNPGNNPVSIPNTFQFSQPLNQTNTTWYYDTTVSDASNTITFPVQSFTISPQAYGGCEQYGIDTSPIALTNPLPSSTVVNDFPNWVVSTPNLLEGCNYQLQVSYLPGIGSYSPHSDETTFSVTPGGIVFQGTGASSTNDSSVSIPKSINIWNFYNATTTEVKYTAILYDADTGNAVGLDSGQFYIGYSSTSSAATTPPGFDSTLQCGGVCNNFGTVGSGAGVGSIFTSTSTVATAGQACPSPSGPTDIGGGIYYGVCETLNFLFVPNATTNGILAGDLNALQQSPPFSWFFMTNNTIYQATANGSASSTPLAFTIYTGINGATTTMTLMPADPTTNSFLSNGILIDDWYNFLLTLCVIVVIIMLYKLAL